MWSDREGPNAAIIDLIYDAALSPELWTQVLIGIADMTGSMGGILYQMAPHRGEVLGRALGRLDPDLSRIYEERHFVNPWATHMFTQPAGALVLSDEILSLRELSRTEFYADVIGPQGIGHNYMAALIARPDLSVAFNITRSVREGVMSHEQRFVLDRLMPHLRRASQLHLRVEQYETLREASLGTLDRLTMGVVIVDRWASVLFANQTAIRSAQMLGLSLLPDRAVSAAPPHGARLKQLIHRAINGGAGGAIAFPDPAEIGLPVSMLVAPLRGRIADEIGAGYLSGASAVLFIRDPNVTGEPDAAALAGWFGLTPGEARVAVVLFKGEDFAVAAAELGISINTLKTHARRIFGKLGVKRHSQFVRSLADRSVTIRSP